MFSFRRLVLPCLLLALPLMGREVFVAPTGSDAAFRISEIETSTVTFDPSLRTTCQSNTWIGTPVR